MSINGNFQLRRDTAANWTSANPVLLSGELALETDTAKIKIGNGSTAWNSLAYGGIAGPTGAQGIPGNVMTPITLDFGTLPVWGKAFTVSDGSVTTSNKIMVHPNPNSDEYEMDSFACSAYCSVNGTVNIMIQTTPGPVQGSYNFTYSLG
jgi:hypothetical protein